MVEANASVHLTQLHASMSLATNTLALQRAMKAAKAGLQAQGLRPSHFSHRDLVIRTRREGLKHRSFSRAEFQFKMRNGK